MSVALHQIKEQLGLSALRAVDRCARDDRWAYDIISQMTLHAAAARATAAAALYNRGRRPRQESARPRADRAGRATQTSLSTALLSPSLKRHDTKRHESMCRALFGIRIVLGFDEIFKIARRRLFQLNKI